MRHDAAAVSLGGSAYVFGGGNGPSQLDEIVKVAAGGAGERGRSPAAARIRRLAAVIAGHGLRRRRIHRHALAEHDPRLETGRGAAGGRARLPVALRYAAVTAAGGKLLIAGGSTPSGTRQPNRARLRSHAPNGARRSPAAGADHARRRRDAERDRVRDRRSRRGRPGPLIGRISAIDPASGRLRPPGRWPRRAPTWRP